MNVGLDHISLKAGLTMLEEKFHVFDIVKNPEKVSRILAQQKPLWSTGEIE